MGLNLKTIPTGFAGYFKPDQHRGALAILVEVKNFIPLKPSKLYEAKDTIVADVAIFADEAAVRSNTPTSTHQGMMIDKTILVRDLHDNVGIGSATIVTVDQSKPKPGQRPAWIWRSVADESIVNAVVAYAEQRDAAVEEAVASAPSFD